MNAHEFSAALGEIDLKYVGEALAYRKKSGYAWVKWSAIAACLVVVIAAAWNLPGLLPGGPNPPQPIPLPVADPTQTELPEQGTPPVDQMAEPYQGATAEPVPTPPETAGDSYRYLPVPISLSDVTFNELGPQPDAARLWRDPEKYETVTWDAKTVKQYYGRDLAPAYVPPYLTPNPGNGALRAVVSKEDGTVVEDAAYLGFYEIYGYYESGEPRTVGYDIVAPHGFGVAVSKVGLLTDCIYILPENEVKATDIGGVEVIFGYRDMPYGPYDPDTHAPSGYYDFVEADFTLDGAEYQLHFYQMDRSEVVKVVASLILGTEDITVAE